MKKICSLFLFLFIILSTFALLSISSVEAFAQVNDNFSDGDFTANPVWNGDVSEFIVNGSKQLQLNNTVASASYLSTTSSISSLNNIEWRFYIKQSFSPSGSNYGRVYLASDQANLEASLNGYYLQFGEAGSLDAVELFRQTGTTSTSVARGTNGEIATSFSVGIKVSRNSSGDWNLYVDPAGGANYALEVTGTDNTYTTTNFFGVATVYTISYSTNFYFDDFYAGPIVLDTVLPSLVSVAAISQNQLDVYFSEIVDTTSANNELNYSVSGGIGNPASAVRDAVNSSKVNLSFSSNFVSGTTYTITVSGIQDLSANTMTADSDTFYYYLTQPRDVVINEIMADINPVPNVLPPYEYLELYNRTNFPINLNGWELFDAVDSVTLPNITILPDSFYILTSTTGALALSLFGPVIGLASFLDLNATGDDMVLRDAGGNIMSFVSYDLSWYQDAVKENGGWSIEQIDPNNPCGGINNWKASVDANGGTPGKRNSINAPNPDVAAPKLLRATVLAPDTIQLFFSEPMDNFALQNPIAFTIDNGIGSPTSANPAAPDYSSVVLGLPFSLISGIIYKATASVSVKDCAGNAIPSNSSVRVALAQPVSLNDVVINEILFDPNENGVEWVEIYNRSQKVIDLNEIYLCSREASGNFSEITQISSGGYLIFPEDYFVLSENTIAIKMQYTSPNAEGFIDMSSIPSLNNDSDFVFLINTSQTAIDQLKYKSDWHLPLLSITKGISLERINYNNATQDESNWHSAAESIGFATPAYKNSQYTEGAGGDEVILSPEVFSPDNDGTNDVLSISYAFETPGMIANVTIYDSRGRKIKALVRNELLATSGTFFWDGITDEKLKARIGIYIVYFEAFSEKGSLKKYKKSCVVGGKL